MKLFLAAADNAGATDALRAAGGNNLLATAYRSKKYFLDAVQANSHRDGVSWILDSGLFTYIEQGLRAMREGVPYDTKELLRYCEDYIHYLEKSRPWKHSHVVELDVQGLLGLDECNEYRERITEIVPDDRVIHCYHLPEEEADGIEGLADRYPYISIAVQEINRIEGDTKVLVSDLIRRARSARPDVKIHLLGCTKTYILEQTGYDTCDSASWQHAVSGTGLAKFDSDTGKFRTVNMDSIWDDVVPYIHKIPARYTANTRVTLATAAWQAQQYLKMEKMINERYY